MLSTLYAWLTTPSARQESSSSATSSVAIAIAPTPTQISPSTGEWGLSLKLLGDYPNAQQTEIVSVPNQLAHIYLSSNEALQSEGRMTLEQYCRTASQWRGFDMTIDEARLDCQGKRRTGHERIQ